jgi:hypothetical protein
MARTIQEKTIDRLLTLYIVDRCRTKHSIRHVSETKIHKLLFYSEKKLNESRCKALNYRFIKLLFPTFSSDLRNDLTELTELGFLDGPYFSERAKAKMILDDFRDVLCNNQEIMEIIDSQVDKYAPIPTDKLVKRTKRMKWRNKTIASLAKRTPLVYPLKNEKATSLFNISDEDYEDLAICLSPEISAGMEQAFDELRRGKRLTHEEVFR